VLEQQSTVPVRVFTVWQPMLATDLAPPITAVLGRVWDRRAQQYWDPERLIAKRMAADARAPQPEPDCCEKSGVLWDLAAVYPRGATWTDRLPAAVLFNGPVVDVADAVATVLRDAR
jgi:hypothetical protein